jgi:aldehyde dehydrogenase (NAD+)
MDSAERLNRVFRAQKAHALSLRESTAGQRIARLERLRAAVEARADEVCAACHADFQKPEPEARLAELLPVYSEISHAVRDLRHWMKPRKVKNTTAMLGTRAEIRFEPKGTALIIAPWNYPFQLAIGPLVSAIAAGNTAIIKPSEMTPHVSALVAKLVRDTFPEEEVAVFEGGVETSTALLDLPFDHIFFTGSPAVGRIVMAAAARHLASVTLELGGKSPVVVDSSADIKTTARNIAWGKLTNGGQTCIAPDHLYVHESVVQPLLEEIGKAIRKSYGKNEEAIRNSPDYCRIVNEHHFERVRRLFDDAVRKGATVAFGGDHDASQNFFAPTVLTEVPASARIMEEEIFGPLLPIIPFNDLDDVIGRINAQPKPLALYVFGKNRERIETIVRRTSAGGMCINHNLLHYGHENLPFGGVNNSGIGKSHGVFSFEAFSNQKPVLTNRFSAMHLLYPPYTARVKRLINWAVKRLG